MAWFLPILGALTVGGSVYGLHDAASSDTESAGLSADQLLQYENIQLAQAQVSAAAAPAALHKQPAVIILGGAALVGLALFIGGKIK